MDCFCVFFINTVLSVSTVSSNCFAPLSSSSPAGKDLVPEQEVKVQEAVEARRQPAWERPYAGFHVPLPALPDHPTNLGRLGLFQRSKHADQQLHAGLLSLVLVPTSRFNAEIDWWGDKAGELSGGLRISPPCSFQRSLQFVSAQRLDAGGGETLPLLLCWRITRSQAAVCRKHKQGN